MPLCVIEGVDKCGKTTLARELERRGWEYVHSGPPTRHPLVEYVKSLESYQPEEDHFVLDRWHIGEAVWPLVFGRETDYTWEMFDYTNAFLASRGAVVVTCLGSELGINSRGETSGWVRHALALYRGLGKSDLDLDLDANGWGTMGVADIIERMARWKAVKASITLEAMGGELVGARGPLLVGDEIGPGNLNGHKLPFVPYPATSGAYLARALAGLKYRLTNSTCDVRGLLTAAGDTKSVVALGKSSARRLQEQGVKHREVPHPQYWRRFHHRDVLGYRKLVKEAISG